MRILVVSVLQEVGHEGEYYILLDAEGNQCKVGDGSNEYWAIANAIDDAFSQEA